MHCCPQNTICDLTHDACRSKQVSTDYQFSNYYFGGLPNTDHRWTLFSDLASLGWHFAFCKKSTESFPSDGGSDNWKWALHWYYFMFMVTAQYYSTIIKNLLSFDSMIKYSQPWILSHLIYNSLCNEMICKKERHILTDISISVQLVEEISKTIFAKKCVGGNNGKEMRL